VNAIGGDDRLELRSEHVHDDVGVRDLRCTEQRVIHIKLDGGTLRMVRDASPGQVEIHVANGDEGIHVPRLAQEMVNEVPR